jgi:hypothetical protein
MGAPGERTPAGAKPQDQQAATNARREDGSQNGQGGAPKTDFPSPPSERNPSSQAKTETTPAQKSGTDSNAGSDARKEDLNPPNQRPANDRPDLPRGAVPGADQQDQNVGASGATPPQGQKPPKAELQSGQGGAKKDSTNAATKTRDDQTKGRMTNREAVPKTDGEKSKDAPREKYAKDEERKPEKKYTLPEPKKQPDRERTPGRPEEQNPLQPPESQNPPLQDQLRSNGSPSGSRGHRPDGSTSQQGLQGQPQDGAPHPPDPNRQGPGNSQSSSQGQGQPGQGQQGQGQPGQGQQGQGQQGQGQGQGQQGQGQQGQGQGQGQQGQGQGQGQQGQGQQGQGQGQGQQGQGQGQQGQGQGQGQSGQGSQRASSGVGNEAGRGAPSSAQGQGGQSGQAGSSSQPSSGQGGGQGTGQMPGGGGTRTQFGGGGNRDGAGDPGSESTAKDESKPSPPAEDPNHPFGTDDVAPRGQNQSNLTIRGLTDALKDAQTAKELEDASRMTKEQLEQFARKFEKPNAAPGREAKDIEVKVGEQAAAKPGSNLPTVAVKTSTERIRARGDMTRDPTRGNLNEGNRGEPPRELRDRVYGYKIRLNGMRPASRSAASKPATK